MEQSGRGCYSQDMLRSPDARRRWFGAICLIIATGMLILGQTIFKARLQQQAFIYYWLICTMMTGLTLMVALWDMRTVRRRLRKEQRDLVKDVLQEISDPDEETPDQTERE